jgi:hypothetical protein
VRVLKTEDVGYIPAENVETPYERLARLNKHRNIDIAAPTREEAAIGEAPREKKLRSFIGWKSRTPDQADPPKEGRRVVFAPPTYVEHPGITWDEEEVEEETQQQTVPLQEHEYAEDDIDQDLDDDGYDAEPDDGVEWAQDAVEVVRSGAGAGAGAGANLQAVPESSLDHTVESRETAIVTPENAQLSGGASSIASTDKAAAAAAAAAAVAAGGVAAAGVTHPPAPARLPSPSAPTGALARTNPTPPPHRAGLTSPENSMRGISVTPPPPPSSDAHAYVAAQATARSPPITPKSAARLSVLDTQPAGAGAGAGAASAAVAGAAAAGAVAMASSAPSTSSKTRYPPKTRVMQYHADVFEITRLATLVRARSDEDRRTRRPARAPDADAVQAKLYGERIALDVLHPDVRAGYVHLQARMDAFDREVDSLLGALVAIR